MFSLLAGCVAAPPPTPYVAYPGPSKTPALFVQDDASCRAAAAQSVTAAAPRQPAAASQAPNAQAAGAQAAVAQAAAAQAAAAQPPPEAVYLQCMASHDNIVRPLAPPRPPPYAYYVPDPLYPYGDYAPFLYGDFVGIGFFGGCCGVLSRGFYRGGYGGGFRDGGGFRGGGGFQGGGFHGGGGFHR